MQRLPARMMLLTDISPCLGYDGHLQVTRAFPVGFAFHWKIASTCLTAAFTERYKMPLPVLALLHRQISFRLMSKGIWACSAIAWQ